MKICVSDGVTFKYFFNIPESLSVREFLPILGSYLGFKSQTDLASIRLSTLPDVDSRPYHWAVDVDFIKEHALDMNIRFDTLRAVPLNGVNTVQILVSGVTQRQLSYEISPPGTYTPSESYDVFVPTKEEDYDLFNPSVLIYAIAMKSAQRGMIKLDPSFINSSLIRPDVDLDLDESYGIPSALSLPDFLNFIKKLFPSVSKNAISLAFGLKKPFVTVADLDRILKICAMPLMHASFKAAVRTAFMLTNIPLTKAYPISPSLKTQYVIATVEPLLKIMLEVALRAGLYGGYFGVNAGWLPRRKIEELLRSSGPGSFMLSLSNTRANELALSYLEEVPNTEFDLANPFPSASTDSHVRRSSTVDPDSTPPLVNSRVIHEILEPSPSGNGYILRGEEYISPAAALIANTSFLKKACMQGALATAGFGYQIGKAAERQSIEPFFVLLDKAIRHGFANTDMLDGNLLEIMRSIVLGDLHALGNQTRSISQNLLTEGFLPKNNDQLEIIAPVSKVFANYSPDLYRYYFNSPEDCSLISCFFLGFHGTHIYEETCLRLKDKQPGAYLLRASQSERNSLVLAYVDLAGRVQQIKIRSENDVDGRPTGRLVCLGQTFISLYNLLRMKDSILGSDLMPRPLTPYYDKPWVLGVNLFELTQTRLYEDNEALRHIYKTSDILFHEVAPALVPAADAPIAPFPSRVLLALTQIAETVWTSISNILRPTAAPVQPSVLRTYENMPRTRLSLPNYSRLAETVWASVIENPISANGIALRAEEAVVLPKDFSLIMTREEIYRLLDDASGNQKLRTLSFLLERLTHRFEGELNSVRFSLNILPRAMQEKLIAYSRQTEFYVNPSVLETIELSVAQALSQESAAGDVAADNIREGRINDILPNQGFFGRNGERAVLLQAPPPDTTLRHHNLSHRA